MAKQQVRVRAVPDEWVELEHKDIDDTFRAPQAAVEHWKARGWTPVTKKSAQSRAAGTES